jgi:hypothetical protein
MHAASPISWMEFVIAPLPKEVARPATVGECQRRAQWSIVFVPSTERTNF